MMDAAGYAAIFRAELERGAVDFAGEAQAIVDGPAGAATLAGAIDVYCGQLERTRETADLLGLAGLAAAAEVVAANVRGLADAGPQARAEAMAHLRGWPAAFIAYLDAIERPDAARALVDFLASAAMPGPVDANGGASLLALLAEGATALAALCEGEAEESAPAALEAADLAPGIPADCDARVRASFLDEAPTLAERLVTLVGEVVAGTASPEARRGAKRAAHSLKGSASIVGARAVATVAHALEDLLEPLAAEAIAAGPALGALLLDGAGALAQVVDALVGSDRWPDDLHALAGRLRDAAWRVRREGLDAAEASIAAAERRGDAPRAIHATPTTSGAWVQAMESSAPAPTPALPQAANAESAALRVPVATVDELFRLLGELGTRVVRLQSELRDARADARALRNALDGVEAFRDGVLAPIFDALDQTSRGIDDRLGTLSNEAVHHERIQRELGRLVLSTRMLPASTLVPRLRRNLRQTCRQIGKEAELRVAGEHILVDGDMLEALAEPLLHLLRNAVDHGIEGEDERVRAGKSPVGMIEVLFGRRGPVVTVVVRDDGRGLDYDAIFAKAIERGLLRSQARPTRAELARLTLEPGFSTRDAVSEVSGRGVGMDVVHERLAAMKGTVDIASEPGQGCAITLRFQATLVSQHALIVESAGQTLALPSHHVEIALAPGMADFVVVDGHPAAVYHGETYRLHALATLAGFGQEAVGPDTVRGRPLVLVRGGDRLAALACDRLLDGRELIVKGTGRWFKRVSVLSGAVILANGRVAPVVDVAELVRAHYARERAVALSPARAMAAGRGSA